MAEFEKQSKLSLIKSMLKVDFRRLITTPLGYIMAGISLVMPVLILVMTSMIGSGSGEDGGEAAVAFTNVWQSIGSLSGGSTTSMDLVSMCNINLIYFMSAVFVCVFIADDFRSGYAKNLFAVRADKKDYVISKTVVGFAVSAVMILCYFIGALIGGKIAGLSFAAGAAGAGGIAACLLSKIFLTLVFVAIFTVMAVVAKHRLWLSVLLSLGAGMLLFSMVSMITPLDSSFVNVIMCAAGGALFAAGFGALSCVVLNKTSLV